MNDHDFDRIKQCDKESRRFLKTPECRTFRLTNIGMLACNTATLAYVGYIVYRHWAQKANSFTVILVTLITVSLIMGSALYILLIIALERDSPKNNPGVFEFVMGSCSLRLSLMSDAQEYMQWVSAMFMAYKYHQVAR